ncbi:MAG: UbiX family flavin prenyltransferase [Deltaproteobacteria bacterium]|nr:UbiX family flavin prenyltransferase [Deltaproteobacteria bacterium]
MKPLIIAMTGATGAIYGIRLLQVLREKSMEVHLVMSAWAEKTISLETNYAIEEVRKLAKKCYAVDDLSAPISSGSFPTEGMVIIPCSMKTLAGIAHGISENLILRAADVMLKERRKLILVPRESPLSLIHLRNMTLAAEAGAVLLPPMAAFYFKPQSIADLIDHLVGKVLDLLGVEHHLFPRWGE